MLHIPMETNITFEEEELVKIGTHFASIYLAALYFIDMDTCHPKAVVGCLAGLSADYREKNWKYTHTHTHDMLQCV